MPSQRRCLLVAIVLLAAGCGSPAPSLRSVTPGPSAGAANIDRDRLEADLEALQAVADANGGVRTTGTPGYEASVEHVAAELNDIGFAVETPTVGFTGFRELPGSILEVGAASFRGPDELHALIYSPGGDIRGPVAILEDSGCDPDDFDAVPPGAVALTTLGGCFRRDQAINAAAAGVSALLVGYPGRGPGEIFRPTLIDPGGIEIPVVSVTDAAVEALTGAEGQEVHLAVETEREPATLRNVIGQLGEGPSVVMIGAHLDSVLDGPGINDNGSGVAAVLEIARSVAASGVPDGWAVRIGLWGGEEFGTIGSRAYTSEIGDEVAAYLNLDMTGSVNGATLVYDEPEAAPGSERITEAFEAWLAEHGEESHRADLGGSSDHFGFREAGIPTGGLFAGASETGSASQPSGGSGGEPMDPCYHIACDNIVNVDIGRVALFAEATLAVALELMDSEG
jgi:Zn-dependent M28 family amino/carboxypeptidase